MAQMCLRMKSAIQKPQAEGFKAEDEPAFDTKTDAPAEEKAESEEKSDDSNPVSENFEIPDFDKTSEKTKEADNFDAADNFELPEFPEDSLDSKTDDDFSGLKDNDFADLKNDDFSDLKSEDFELPDFDKTVTENSAKPEGLSGYAHRSYNIIAADAIFVRNHFHVDEMALIRLHRFKKVIGIIFTQKFKRVPRTFAVVKNESPRRHYVNQIVLQFHHFIYIARNLGKDEFIRA